MANILFLAHRIPYPPNKGDKIRSWNFLSHLIEYHTVHLGFFIDDPNDVEHVEFLKKQTASLSYEVCDKRFQKLRACTGLITGQPLTLAAYSYGKLRKYAAGLLQSDKIDFVFLFSAATGAIIEGLNVDNVITDLVDVDSEKWRSYSKQALWPLSVLYRREANLLASYEGKLAALSEATLLVSEQEASLFKSLNIAASGSTHAVPNGVDLSHFLPRLASTESPSRTVLFTGAMDYQPNVEAVVWFADKVWPTILEKLPDAVFKIAGGPVATPVKKLQVRKNIIVTGYVNDMADEIAGASVCIAPLQTARGIQNKVLEAMAMGKVVVASSLANEGINAADGETIFIADEPDKFGSLVMNAIFDPDANNGIGKNARKFVENQFSWANAFKILDSILEEVR